MMRNRWAELDRLPWEQLFKDDDNPDHEGGPEKLETDISFRAFAKYRDLGPTRSLRALARQELPVDAEDNQVENKARGYARWSKANRWVARANEFDAFMDYTRWAEREEALVQMESRHAAIGVRLQQVALDRLESLNPASMGATAVTQMLREAVQIERLARGAATERAEISGRDGGPIEITTPASEQVRERLEQMRQNREEVAELTEGL